MVLNMSSHEMERVPISQDRTAVGMIEATAGFVGVAVGEYVTMPTGAALAIGVAGLAAFIDGMRRIATTAPSER